MAGIILLMLLSFGNQLHGFLTEREAGAMRYDPSVIGGRAEALETATLKQPKPSPIGYACRTVELS